MEARCLKRGFVELKNGEEREALTIIVRSPYKKHTTKELKTLVGKMIKPYIGAWRVKPQEKVTECGNEVRCRVFIGEPSEYYNLKSMKGKKKETKLCLK